MTASGASAEAGDTIALGKLDAVKTGDTLSNGKTAPSALVKVEPVAPVLAMSLSATDRKDDVKLGQALLRAQRGRSLALHGTQPAHPRHRAVGTG